MPARCDLEADARICNARRLMRNALSCYAQGHDSAGNVLRSLARMEHSRAARLMIVGAR